MTKEISASEQIHEVLAREHNGYRFTAAQLQQIVKLAGYKDMTFGAVSGFIFRACQKKMVMAEAKRRGSGRGKAHMAIVYVLVDRTITWDFKPPSQGRTEGSVNVGTEVAKQSSLPFLDGLLQDTGLSGLADEGVIGFAPVTNEAEYMHRPGHFETAPDGHRIYVPNRLAHSRGNADGQVFTAQTSEPNLDELIETHFDQLIDGVPVDLLIQPVSEPKKEIYEVIEGGLADQLLQLAHQVAELEAKPEFSLADFSTTELLDEIKRRLE